MMDVPFSPSKNAIASDCEASPISCIGFHRDAHLAPIYAFSLPFPPSVNGYWRAFGGRTILSAKGRTYKKLVAQVLREEVLEQAKGNLSVDIYMSPPDKRTRDIDNYAKGLFDSLTNAGVWLDDSQVKELRIKWLPCCGKEIAGVTVLIYPMRC